MELCRNSPSNDGGWLGRGFTGVHQGEQLLRSSRLVHCPTAGGAKFTSSVFGQGSGLVAHMLGSVTAAPQYVRCILK